MIPFVIVALVASIATVYLLFNNLRVRIEPGEIDGVEASQAMYLFIAVIMLVPIVMVVLTLILPYPAIRWVSIIVAIVVVIFNLFGLPYKGMYDNFLIAVSIVFNALTVWYAWQWTA